MKKNLASILIFLGLASSGHAFTLSNFQTPESMVMDPQDGSYYISNINSGGFTDKNGSGYISKVTSNGNIVIQKFIGLKKEEMLLNAPKGLVILGKNIFVTDIDSIKGFDKETGKPTVLVDLSKLKVKFLNDITVDGRGMLYVSDTMTNQIFKIDTTKNYEVGLFKEGKELGQPNGLMINPKSKNLMVATYGSGQILEIDPAGKVHVLKRGLSTLDGIDYDAQGNLYVSSFEKGEIYKIAYLGRGALSTYLSGLTTPADISYDRGKGEILVPSMKGSTVSTFSTQEIQKKNHSS